MAELTSSTREAARRLGVSDTTMHKAERTGRITRDPDGRNIAFRARETNETYQTRCAFFAFANSSARSAIRPWIRSSCRPSRSTGRQVRSSY